MVGGSLCTVQAAAQTARGRDAVARRIESLRREVTEAIRRRDRATLERLYADEFTHTHASGQVDGKAKRIAALVSGEPTIESAEASDVSIRTYGAQTAVVTGQSAIRSQTHSRA